MPPSQQGGQNENLSSYVYSQIQYLFIKLHLHCNNRSNPYLHLIDNRVPVKFFLF